MHVRANLERLRQPIVEATHRQAATHTGIRVWDPFPILCHTDNCSPFDNNGRPLFFDGDHISAYGNVVLYPSLTATILGIPAQPDAAQATRR